MLLIFRQFGCFATSKHEEAGEGDSPGRIRDIDQFLDEGMETFTAVIDGLSNQEVPTKPCTSGRPGRKLRKGRCSPSRILIYVESLWHRSRFFADRELYDGAGAQSPGFEQKILNPEPEERKPLREFYHVLKGLGSVALQDCLGAQGVAEMEGELVAVRHAPGTYAVFQDKSSRGILTKKDDSSVLCSSLQKGAEPIA